MLWARLSIAHRIRPRALSIALALPTFAAALGLGAASANGGEGLYLSWNDCRLSSGNPGLTSLCDDNNGDQRLYCSFTLPQPIDEVLGIEAVVDLQAEGVTLPDWWHLEPANVSLGTPAGCRNGSLSATHDFTGETGCTAFWPSLSSAVIQGFAPGDPRGGSAQARIKAAVAMSSPNVASLDDTHTYYGVKLILNNAKTVDPGSCSGCLTNVCLVLNAIWIKRTPGAAGGDRLLETPGNGNANWATWQGTAADCVAVPVRRATWGQIKSLYR
jgi:hypothetical protein